jgi:hypothetical protein
MRKEGLNWGAKFKICSIGQYSQEIGTNESPGRAMSSTPKNYTLQNSENRSQNSEDRHRRGRYVEEQLEPLKQWIENLNEQIQALLNRSMNGKKSPHPCPLGEGIGILALFSPGRRAGLRRERSAERDEGQSLLHSGTPNYNSSPANPQPPNQNHRSGLAGNYRQIAQALGIATLLTKRFSTEDLLWSIHNQLGSRK